MGSPPEGLDPLSAGGLLLLGVAAGRRRCTLVNRRASVPASLPLPT